MTNDINTMRQGFSLIQISALLAVLAILMVAMLPGGGDNSSDAVQPGITQQRMEDIETAMQSFMVANMRRPCPASFSAATTSANFGTEQITSGVCTSTAGTAEYVGMVPVKALNLGEEYAFDAYGRRLEYRVDKRATLAGSIQLVSTAASCYDLQNAGQKGAIEILSTATDTVPADNVMWALISRGRDRYGSYSAQGSGGALAGATDVDTLANIAVTGVLVKKEPTSTFDDIVWYSEPTKNTCCKGKACNLGFKVSTESSGTASPYYGVNIASGDINGDGIKDIVLTNNVHTPNNVAYIILGSKTGWPVGRALNLNDITQGDGTYGMVIQNDSAYVDFAMKPAVGDINGDGYDDVALSGKNYITVVFGESMLPDYKLKTSQINGTNGFILYHSASVAGGTRNLDLIDIDGDGKKDLVWMPTTVTLGVVFGRSSWASPWAGGASCSGTPYVCDVATVGVLTSTVDDDGFKISASGYVSTNHFSMAGGDVNDDGYEDVLMGNSATNRAMLLFGRARGTWVGSVITIPGSGSSGEIYGSTCPNVSSPISTCKAMTFTGSSPSSFGTAVNIGDMDQDGMKDLIIADANYVYIYNGRVDASWPTSVAGAPTPVNLDTTPANVIINTSTSRPSWFAAPVPQVISAGDINGDGKQDLLLGMLSSGTPSTCKNDANRTVGSVYVLIQPSGGWPSSADLFTGTANSACDANELNTSSFPGSFRIDGAVAYDYAFNPLALDFNADGKNDIFIAAPGNVSSRPGYLYTLWGRRTLSWGEVVDLLDLSDDDAAETLDLTDL